VQAVLMVYLLRVSFDKLELIVRPTPPPPPPLSRPPRTPRRLDQGPRMTARLVTAGLLAPEPAPGLLSSRWGFPPRQRVLGLRG
jgi:hypothetical protein